MYGSQTLEFFTDKRRDETTQNKALFMGTAISIDKYQMTEWLSSNDRDLIDEMPEFDGEIPEFDGEIKDQVLSLPDVH